MQIKQDKYVNHKEMTEILQGFVRDYPEYVELEEIGKSLKEERCG